MDLAEFRARRQQREESERAAEPWRHPVTPTYTLPEAPPVPRRISAIVCGHGVMATAIPDVAGDFGLCECCGNLYSTLDGSVLSTRCLRCEGPRWDIGPVRIRFTTRP